MIESDILLLPGEYGFNEILETAVLPGQGNKVAVINPYTGIPEYWDGNSKEFIDYLFYGEYDEQLEECGQQDPETVEE